MWLERFYNDYKNDELTSKISAELMVEVCYNLGVLYAEEIKHKNVDRDTPVSYTHLYSSSLDYPIEIEGETLYPGQSYEKYLERKNGKHARADWAWRWSKDKFDWGYKNDFVVLKKYDRCV